MSQGIAQEYKKQLGAIQNELFVLGAQLANPQDESAKSSRKTPAIEPQHITALELAIDQMNETLPAMTHFILPGGHTIVSYCHIARTICRRGERRATLLAEHQNVPPLVIQYLNRLSDYLFVLARKLTSDLGVEEIKWEPPQ
jgi:cob(I)alamin adenosyltransferase